MLRKTMVAQAILSIAFALSISGCLYIPPIGEDKAIDPDRLVVGKTTRDEAIRILGKPAIVSGRFIYDELYSSSGGIAVFAGQGGYLPIDGQHARLLLEFNQSGTLIKKDVKLGRAQPSNVMGVAPLYPADRNPDPLGQNLRFENDSWFSGPPSFHAAAFSPDGALLAASDSSDNLYLIDVNRRSFKTISPESYDSDGYVFSMAFSPDGNLLAVLSRTVRIIDMKTLLQIVAFEGHGNAYFWDVRGANSMAFAPSGKVIASAGTDGTVKIWEPETGREILSWSTSKEGVYGIAFSPDGRILATASGDGVLRLWESRSGTELASFEARGIPVFTSDGSELAIANPAYAELRMFSELSAESSSRSKITVSDPTDMIILPYFSFRPHEAIFPRDATFREDDGALLMSLGPTVIWNWREGKKASLAFPFEPDILNLDSRERFLAFGPRGHSLATFGSDGVHFWSISQTP
jgi:WD40 repeat protein